MALALDMSALCDILVLDKERIKNFVIDIRIGLQKENQKQKVKHISKTIGGDIKLCRSPVSKLILNFKRGGTLNICTVKSYKIFNRVVQRVYQNNTQKFWSALDKAKKECYHMGMKANGAKIKNRKGQKNDEHTA